MLEAAIVLLVLALVVGAGAVGWFLGHHSAKKLGLLYFSTSNASPDFNGGVRPGDNLFASSIVALDAESGKYKWHFQEVHHDIWDYDAPSPTVLFDVNGEHAIAQVGKTGFVSILDRATGKPLYGIPEQAVPQPSRRRRRRSPTPSATRR